MAGKGSKGKSVVTARSGPSAVVIAGIVVVALFVVAVGFGIWHAQKQQDGGAAIPPNATAQGIPIGQASAPATVDIYLDLQCPICKQYEATNGATVDGLIANGSARVIYHPVAFLDRMSDSQYSTRGSGAAACAAADKVFPQFIKLLYANQPPEDGHGLSDQQLVAYGKQVGAGPDFEKCVTDHTYAKWTAAVTDQASKAGVNGIPTVLVNGKTINSDPFDPASGKALTDAVAAVKK